MDLDSEEERAAHEAQRQEQERAFADLLTWLKETLSDHVKEVRLSNAPDHVAGLPDNRHLRHHTCARAHVPGFRTTVPVGKRSLELNPKYSLVTGLQQAHKAGGDDAQMRRLVETAELLYGTPFLADGGIPEDPAKFADHPRTAWLALCTTRDPSLSSSEAPLDHSVTAVKARLERGRG